LCYAKREQKYRINFNFTSKFCGKDEFTCTTYEVNRKLATFEAANLGLAAENLDISMDRYRLGAISAVELRDVQRSYISATNRLLVATYNAKVAETALKLLTGEVLRVE